MGPNGVARYDANRPSAAYDASTDQFLIVWHGDDLIDNEFEIYGQRLSASGDEVGANDFQISRMGPDRNPGFGAEEPNVAYNVKPGEYLAVWSGDDDAKPLVKDEQEIFGRRALPGSESVLPGGARPRGRGPRLRLRARKRQRLVRQRAAIVYATSDERATLRATGRISIRKGRRLKTRTIRRVVRANRRTKLRLRLSRRTRARVRRALRRKRRTIARVTVRVTDAEGNSTTRRVRIRARR
jgi:hypothetical protein